MDCIYCGHKTSVLNSRPQKRLRQVWRRRECSVCKAVFTTHEVVELAGSVVVRRLNGRIAPFSRDTLFVSLLQALGHRKDPIGDASALTATITVSVRKDLSSAAVSTTDIVAAAHTALKLFDKSAAVSYAAYHQQ